MTTTQSLGITLLTSDGRGVRDIVMLLKLNRDHASRDLPKLPLRNEGSCPSQPTLIGDGYATRTLEATKRQLGRSEIGRIESGMKEIVLHEWGVERICC